MSKRTRFLVISGLIAALYAALTYMSALLGLAYGQVQLRLSEALCMLCAFSPAAVAGLTVGCLIGNIASSLGLIDMIIGTAATLAAALMGRCLRKVKLGGFPVLIPIAFILINALAVGVEITLATSGSEATFAIFAVNAALIGAGEAIATVALGLPFYAIISRSSLPQILNFEVKS